MRVAMLSYHTCPLATLGGKDTGGMNVYVRELSRSLGAEGVQVDVFTRSQDEHVPHVVHDLGFGNRVVHIPAGPENPLPKPELAEYIPLFSDQIVAFAKEKNIQYDLIHSHYWMSGMAGIELKKAWDIPMTHMFHTLGLMKNRIAGQGEYEGVYRIRGEREVLRNADRIIAATTAELAQLQWLYEVPAEKITIVPPGVNLERFYPIPKEDARDYLNIPCNKRMLLFVGRIEPLKGIDTLIKAVSILQESKVIQHEKFCLAIIGGDASVSHDEMTHEMSRLHQLHHDLGLHDVIDFLGKRDQDSLPYYYSAADVVVVPSHYESFGMVALEALACGTPVVASQVGGLAYVVKDGETGFHVPGQDPKILADKLMLLLQDDKLHQSMSLKAAEDATRYGWGKIAERIIPIYKQLIEK